MEDIQPFSTKNTQPQLWTEDEDNLMMEAIDIYGHNWIQISNHVISRTASQCAQRYKRLKKKQKCQEKKKVTWSRQDKKQLKQLVQQYGQNWKVIADIFGDRNSRQVREKFTNELNSKVKHVPWTSEEDQLIYELFLKYGCKWTSFTKQLTKRSERMIKNRFYTKIRYTHLGLPNAYQEINYQCDPYQQLQQQRLKILKLQDDNLNINNKTQDDISQFLNLTEDNCINGDCDTL